MNIFGGDWTEKKIEIVVKYAKAYLTIMNKQKGLKTIYFDGFAGSGDILKKNSASVIEGTASQIMDIDEPCSFDMYYLVELDKVKATNLERKLVNLYPLKKDKLHIIADDCNKKLIALAHYLNENKDYRALAFVDPQGMQVNWNSMKVFNDINIDMWLLIPTGIGVNRMLTKTGEIDESWISKLSEFLGLSKTDIMKSFYHETEDLTLFGNITKVSKYDKAVEKIISIYQEQLNTVFNFVSEPFPMHNRRNSLMFHLLFVSQNAAAQKIANDIIKKS